MLFADFLEWLQFLGRLSERTNYEWYIKVHPEPLPGTLKVVDEIVKQFPNIRKIPRGVSHLQLVEEGVNFVLTCYGSVGFEYPLLGVPVINAGLNPRIAFDAGNIHPGSVEEYEAILLNLDKHKAPIDVKGLYACYYMHHEHWNVDDLIFPSFRTFSEHHTAEQQFGTYAYEYFLNNLSAERHKKIIDDMKLFITSDKSSPDKKIFSRYNFPKNANG